MITPTLGLRLAQVVVDALTKGGANRADGLRASLTRIAAEGVPSEAARPARSVPVSARIDPALVDAAIASAARTDVSLADAIEWDVLHRHGRTKST